METKMIDDVGVGTTGNLDPPSLVQEIAEVVADPRQWPALTGLLRALARPLLDATVTMRHEPLDPYERTLAFAARRMASAIGDQPVHADPRYVLGRIESLLDLCDMGIDRSISDEVVARARGRKHVRTILAYLMRVRESKASDLASAVGISPNHLSNILSWMEAADLIRRAAAGRVTRITLGPKGEAVHLALAGEQESDALPRRTLMTADGPRRGTQGTIKVDQDRMPWNDIGTEYAGGAKIPLGDGTRVETVAA